MTNAIEFCCWEKDKPLEVQLEPEAILYIVNPGDTIKFVPVKPTEEFRWAVRVDNDTKAVQLFPDPPRAYDGIDVYLNDKIIE
ncbi:MAG: hypothetical protein J7621_12180 [Niastella sp.]|nr:hypothetical protein [Niastella sp.]